MLLIKLFLTYNGENATILKAICKEKYKVFKTQPVSKLLHSQ